jgi:pyruvate, water dikinase
MANKNVAWFKEIDKESVGLVGGKGANLGEMERHGFPVPTGFVVTAEAYLQFLAANKLTAKIKQILGAVDMNNSAQLQQASAKIKALITSSPIPEETSQEIIRSYFRLGRGKLVEKLMIAGPRVAIRSSATSEDSKTASFAGQNETFLNVQGEANVVDAVRRCWASLFEARSIFYRNQQHLDHLQSAIAVVVQAMVPSEVSGIIFSIDPVTNNHQRIIIEAIWGLGEYVVQGKVTPDHYEVNKSDLVIVDRQVVLQKIMLVRGAGKNIEKRVPKSKQTKRKLSDEQIREIAKLSLSLEQHYFFPQDSEFAVADGRVYLVQTRPITTTGGQNSEVEEAQEKASEKQLAAMTVTLTGAPASPGIASGPVKILLDASEIDKISPGEILIAPQTNPDYVPAMRKAAAIVTDKGGRTSHAAIVSRELGIPCVVGTEKATQIFRDGETVTVDGIEGKVYKGGIKFAEVKPNKVSPSQGETLPIKTATKVYVNLAEPDKAKEVAALNCDGVGLLRAEFMLAGIGVHPKRILADGKQRLYVATLAQKITEFARAFYPRPIVYRTTDFKTNEYRSLKGGEKFEPVEENPMIGFRGAYRYVVEPDVFKMEIEAIRKVREDGGFKNLWLMIPFCRTVSELEKVKSLLTAYGLHRSPTFKLWLMCEIPANVILLDRFIEAGIDGISVGSNDLTMLTLGVDRDNEHVAPEYDERNEALLWSFEKIIRTCRHYQVTCSMCGQAPSDFPDLTEKLVEWGITSVSVNPDVVNKTREIVYQAEKKLVHRT